MSTTHGGPWRTAAILVAAVWAGACTDTVYETRPPFNLPPDQTSGYLGYFTPEQKQTNCGNCHVGQQGDWIQTAHSNAWSDLQNSGSAQSSCQGCHSVTSRGNQTVSSSVGYDAVKTDAYQDVQCESCHGPGYQHVQNPSVRANQPLPRMNVDTTASLVNATCGACHTNQGGAKHHNYLKEWKASRHGQLSPQPAGQLECQPCHEGKGVLRAWGINTAYLEQNTSTLIPQTCPVCHDPHGTTKDDAGKPLPGQLRFRIDVPVEAENLCTHCHNRTSTASPTNAGGPHAAQGPVLFGTAGYRPPGFIYDTNQVLTTHGSIKNPRLCAGCHVNAFQGQDSSTTPPTLVTFSGHTFHPLPCLSQSNPPVPDTTFTNACPFDEPSRSWGACTVSGCHLDAATAVNRFNGIHNEVTGYLNVLWVDLNKNKVLDPYPADTGYLPKILLNQPGDLDFTGAGANVLTPAKGALFNAQLTGDSLAVHPDGSHGVHNPFLYRALLQASIADLLSHYGGFLPAPPAPALSKIQASLLSGRLRLAPELERAVLSPQVVSRK